MIFLPKAMLEGLVPASSIINAPMIIKRGPIIAAIQKITPTTLSKSSPKVVEVMGFISVKKSGKLNEQPELMDNFKDDINEEEWDDFKNNYKKLIEQGILELKQYHKKFGSELSISYYWALYHNICPKCLEKIELNKPHFVLDIVEEETAYIKFAKTHIGCIEMISNRYELKQEYEGEPHKYDPFEEFNFEDISDKWVGLTCPYCGLTMDLYELFFDENGPLKDIYKKFLNNNQILGYLQNLCRELYGDISTLIWAKKISSKKVRLVIKKVVMIEGTAYHPNCVIKKFEREKLWNNLSNEQNKEEIE